MVKSEVGNGFGYFGKHNDNNKITRHLETKRKQPLLLLSSNMQKATNKQKMKKKKLLENGMMKLITMICKIKLKLVKSAKHL